MKKSGHIVINGRRYDAKTGGTLSRPVKHATPPAVHHTAVHKTASPAHEPAHKSVRQVAGHASPHRPKPARTLMRQAVKKPPASLKRRIRVQTHLDSQIKQPELPVPARPQPVRHYVARGRKVHLISHFSPNLFTVTTVVSNKPEPMSLISDRPIANHDVTPRPHGKPAFAPKKPGNTAELLEYAIRYADSPPSAEEQGRRKHGRRRMLHRHAHAVAH